MKMPICYGILFLMLFLIAFSPKISTVNAAKAPFEYLTKDEQTYVTNVRSWIALTRVRIDAARTTLLDISLQNATPWFQVFTSKITDVNNGLDELKKLWPPFDFTGIRQQCQALSGFSVEGARIGFSQIIKDPDLINLAKLIDVWDTMLDTLKQKLDKIWDNLDKQVDASAGEAPKKEEDMADQLLQSCGFRPAPD